MIHKQYLLLLIMILLLGVGFFFVDLKPDSPLKKYPITIAVSKTPLSSPFYVAQSIKAFDDTCVDVKYQEVVGGQIAFNHVMAGKVDFGTSSDSVIAFESLTDKTFITHTMFAQSDNDVKLITRTSDNIQSVINLKGKRIGITKETASEYLLSTLLAFDGLTMQDVKLISYNADQIIDAFSENKIDAMIMWEPFVFQATQLLADTIKVHDTKNLSSLSFHLISRTDDKLRVEKATCIIQGLSVAVDYISAYPQESKRLVMEHLNLTPEFIDKVWPDYIFMLGLNQSFLLNIKSQAMWTITSHGRKHIQVPNPEHYVDSRALFQVEPSAIDMPL